jgi:hypothetical protein
VSAGIKPSLRKNKNRFFSIITEKVFFIFLSPNRISLTNWALSSTFLQNNNKKEPCFTKALSIGQKEKNSFHGILKGKVSCLYFQGGFSSDLCRVREDTMV